MNKRMLEAEMKLFGDTGGTLAEALGIARNTFSNKINEKGAEFTQSEIRTIAVRYNLTAEQINDIFFNQKVS